MASHDFDRLVALSKIRQTLSVESEGALTLGPRFWTPWSTLPENSNIYASQHQLYLPSKEDLRQTLIAWAEEVGR